MRATKLGDFVKVSRFGERLWLRLIERRPGDTWLGEIANKPIAWPHMMGDHVYIVGVEFIETMQAPPADVIQFPGRAASTPPAPPEPR